MELLQEQWNSMRIAVMREEAIENMYDDYLLDDEDDDDDDARN